MSFMKKVWKTITYIRIGLANAIFLLFLLVVLIAIFSPKEDPLPSKAPLLVTMSGVLVEEKTHKPSIVDVLNNDRRDTETVLRDIIKAIDHAAKDDNITGLIFNLNHLDGANLSKLEEIGQAISAFKASNKPVIAYADAYSQSQYFLASYADHIYLNSLGNVAVTGFGFFGSYFKEATEKLSIKFHLFKVGDYKDAAEPYVRNSMSEASREHNSQWVNALWDRYTSTIEQNRNIELGTIDSFITNISSTLESGKQDFAILSKEAGLVDDVVSRVALNKALIEKFGKEKDSEYFKAIPHKRYVRKLRPIMPAPANNIGLIVASGTIVDGYGSEGQIGGDELGQLIRQAVGDTSIEALIIRVDSGGGSAFASEIIREEIANARAEGLPVYVSMSSVAASGGYWLATAADEIWSAPTTITGSIGVWGLVPNISESMKKLGIHSDGFGTTNLSDIYNIDRPMSDDAKRVFQAGVNDIYFKFIQLVSNARGQTPEAIHEIAQGRVWTGETALELGLVDQLGSLKDLRLHIAQKHNLTEPNVKVITPPLSTSEQIMQALMEEASAFGHEVKNNVLGDEFTLLKKRLPSTLSSDTFNNVSEHNLRVYAHCLECFSF